MQQVGRIGHGVDQLWRGFGPNYSILEQSDAIWSVSLLGDDEGDQRQPHADKHYFSFADLTGSRCHHEFAKCVSHFAVKTAERFSI